MGLNRRGPRQTKLLVAEVNQVRERLNRREVELSPKILQLNHNET